MYNLKGLHCGCIMPIPSLQLQENNRLMQRSRGFCHELWSPRFVTIVEIELLATVGWKWGCQPCSCRVWQNETHCRKEICWTCLFKESIPAIPFRNSKHPLPGRSNFLTAAARSTLFALGLQKIPSLRCSCRKNLSYDSMQKIIGHEVAVSKMCCNAVIVLSVVLCDCCKP